MSNPAGNVAPRWAYQAIFVEMTDKTVYGLHANQRHKEIRSIWVFGERNFWWRLSVSMLLAECQKPEIDDVRTGLIHNQIWKYSSSAIDSIIPVYQCAHYFIINGANCPAGVVNKDAQHSSIRFIHFDLFSIMSFFLHNEPIRCDAECQKH